MRKSKTFWFDNISHAEMVWNDLLEAGYTKKQRLKIRFNWWRWRTMYQFKVYLPTPESIEMQRRVQEILASDKKSAEAFSTIVKN